MPAFRNAYNKRLLATARPSAASASSYYLSIRMATTVGNEVAVWQHRFFFTILPLAASHSNHPVILMHVTSFEPSTENPLCLKNSGLYKKCFRKIQKSMRFPLRWSLRSKETKWIFRRKNSPPSTRFSAFGGA